MRLNEAKLLDGLGYILDLLPVMRLRILGIWMDLGNLNINGLHCTSQYKERPPK